MHTAWGSHKSMDTRRVAGASRSTLSNGVTAEASVTSARDRGGGGGVGVGAVDIAAERRQSVGSNVDLALRAVNRLRIGIAGQKLASRDSQEAGLDVEPVISECVGAWVGVFVAVPHTAGSRRHPHHRESDTCRARAWLRACATPTDEPARFGHRQRGHRRHAARTGAKRTAASGPSTSARELRVGATGLEAAGRRRRCTLLPPPTASRLALRSWQPPTASTLAVARCACRRRRRAAMRS